MVAAMYLIRAISEAAPNNTVRLFEGFISYKDRADGTDHCGDVELLREVVRGGSSLSTASGRATLS